MLQRGQQCSITDGIITKIKNKTEDNMRLGANGNQNTIAMQITLQNYVYKKPTLNLSLF